jgi:hypothetical protein
MTAPTVSSRRRLDLLDPHEVIRSSGAALFVHESAN